MTEKLTIIGGTGHLSTRVVRLLRARGMRLELVARNPGKARALFGEGVEIVTADVEDTASLRSALQGSRAVYIHLNTEAVDESISFYPEREGVRNIVEAAKANGVAHLIQIAGIEPLRPDFFRSGIINTEGIRRAGMEAVAGSGIPYTFLNCSVFLDSLPRFVAEDSLAVFGNPTNRIHFTNTNQLAEHLFHVAGNPASFGKSLPVQGREGLDFTTAARRFLAVFDPAIKIEQLPIEAIDSFGLPPESAGFLKHVWEVTSGMQEEFIAGEVHQVFGRPVLTIEGFAEKLRGERLETR